MEKNQELDAIGQALDQQLRRQTREIVGKTLAREHHALVAHLVRTLRVSVVGTQKVTTEIKGREWIGVESLSRLRSVVGGRFQNIKKKWVDAGLPLREHRGDRWKEFDLNKDGWLELVAWIGKQGFEARLTPESEEFIFQLRARSP
jgi:hypothetical protein